MRRMNGFWMLALIVAMLVTAVKCLIQYVRGREHVRIELAEGISLALLFKMGGEVLRTVIVRTWDELAILAAIIVIRSMLTFLLHWEIKGEKAPEAAAEAQSCDEKAA